MDLEVCGDCCRHAVGKGPATLCGFRSFARIHIYDFLGLEGLDQVAVIIRSLCSGDCRAMPLHKSHSHGRCPTPVNPFRRMSESEVLSATLR